MDGCEETALRCPQVQCLLKGLTLRTNARMMNELANAQLGSRRVRPTGIQGSVNMPVPPRSMAGQLTLDQHIGVRIPGGQPKTLFPSLLFSMCLLCFFLHLMK